MRNFIDKHYDTINFIMWLIVVALGVANLLQ